MNAQSFVIKLRSNVWPKFVSLNSKVVHNGINTVHIKVTIENCVFFYFNQYFFFIKLEVKDKC